MKEAYIVSAVRTPIGSFGGILAGFSATQLGSFAIKAALEKAGVQPSQVQEVFMGNVISANLGQAPARQAAMFAGLPPETVCTTVNKVCASGTKSVMFAAQSIMLGINDIVVAGGMESMTNVPYYIEKARFGYKYGDGKLVDGLQKDGLWEVYHNYAMGNAADMMAKELGIGRQAQDEYAVRSYQRSAEATQKGYFKEEIVPVSVPQRGKDPLLVTEDEEYKNVNFDKIPGLKPAFSPEGTVTAANASTINDGAAALVLMSKEKADELGIKPLAKIRGFADAEQAPEWFTTSPSLAIPKALKAAGVTAVDVDYYEINEAFSAVALGNMMKLNLTPEQTNVFGGAVSLGHPLGCSGARILVTLTNVLKQKDATLGVVGICNGGGGASAMVIERV
jgi:acetyl-CoA C-acetyltransferase